MAGHYISEGDWPDFSAMMRAWRSGELTRPRGSGTGGREPVAQSRLVCLMENLASGGQARAEILRRDDLRQVQDIAIIGFPIIDAQGPGTRTFTLEWSEDGTDREELPPIRIQSTADEVYELLKQTPLARHLVSVTLGTRNGRHPYRWRISLVRKQTKAGSEDWPLLRMKEHDLGTIGVVQIRNCPYVGTGRDLTVYSVIPTSDPSPLRRGAQCGCRLFADVGWGVTEAEARKIFAIDGDYDDYTGNP